MFTRADSNRPWRRAGASGRPTAVRGRGPGFKVRMAPLEPLAPDQRAVVSLVLQQGAPTARRRSCSGSLDEAVRARAHAGLAALAPANGLPREITGPIADYLLGQQPPRDADATLGLLAEPAPARGWAAGVAEHLAPVAPGPLPEVPGARGGRGRAAASRPSGRTGDARPNRPPAAGRPSRLRLHRRPRPRRRPRRRPTRPGSGVAPRASRSAAPC